MEIVILNQQKLKLCNENRVEAVTNNRLNNNTISVNSIVLRFSNCFDREKEIKKKILLYRDDILSMILHIRN